jgi:hydrogenase maturation protease
MMEESSTLVLGLGNPILGDDGVGWCAAETFRALWEAGNLSGFPSALSARSALTFVEVDCLALGGLSLMERMVGYRRVILIDAALTRLQPFGTVSCFPLEQLPQIAQGHLASSHDTTLQNALAVGHSLGADLPEVIWVVTIEAQNLYEFSEQLSPAVASAIPKAVETVLSCLKSFSTSETLSSQSNLSHNPAFSPSPANS